MVDTNTKYPKHWTYSCPVCRQPRPGPTTEREHPLCWHYMRPPGLLSAQHRHKLDTLDAIEAEEGRQGVANYLLDGGWAQA